MNDQSVAAGDPIAHAARIKAQEDLLQAAQEALSWLESRRAHYPPQMRDGREGVHRKALREAIRQVRSSAGEIPPAPDPQDFHDEEDYLLAVEIQREEIRQGRALTPREREGFARGFYGSENGAGR